MNMRPWREVAIPHEDVLIGKFQQAEFAADLARVHDGTATKEYLDPALFFARTYITEGMEILLGSVAERIAGKGGDPVIQLQTAFGGGKTHTLLAVYHMAQGSVPSSDLAGIAPILDKAGIYDLPKSRCVVLDGTKMAPAIPKKRGSTDVSTLWGELAWQLGGEEGYAHVQDADRDGTSPGKEVLANLLSAYAPCIILIDELVAYIRQFEEGKSYPGGTYESNLSFIQALTESLKAVPNAVLLASLPESAIEAGGEHGAKTLAALEHFFGRVQALWKPVATEEAFEIVRRRLFSTISDTATRDAVCRAYADQYIQHSGTFPPETQESRYYDRLVAAYPIHPELFDRLYEDWGSLENFQRTRGVLKLMAKIIHRLWQDGNNDLLIMPGSVPLYDGATRNELLYYLPQGWDPVVERDIDGPGAETTEIENKDPRFGSIHACRRVARSIFIGSAPDTGSRTSRGIRHEQVLLGAIQPEQQIGIFSDALKRLTERLHHLNEGNNRFWFDTRPNLRREMEDRKRRFDENDDILPRIKKELARQVKSEIAGGIHIFTPGGDIPDDTVIRLVVLPPDAPYGRHELRSAEWCAADLLKKRGEQPRQRQNRLIFLAADGDTKDRLLDQVRSWAAWESIVDDYEKNIITLDNIMGKTAKEQRDRAKNVFERLIRETYRWLLVPGLEIANGKPSSQVTWEKFQLDSGKSIKVEIDRIIRENEIVIERWSPIFLSSILKQWYWTADTPVIGAQKVWHDSCCYLYLPRLKEVQVFNGAITEGTRTREYFGIAEGMDGEKYLGFVFGDGNIRITLDSSLLLIEPEEAARYEEATRPPEVPADEDIGAPGPSDEDQGTRDTVSPPVQKKRRFIGRVEIDPVNAKTNFSEIVDELIQHFTVKTGVSVKIKIDIEAEADTGFDETVQRTVRENSSALRFIEAEFE
ncbi:MAG: ATP-binding protein [Sulfurovum sp.]